MTSCPVTRASPMRSAASRCQMSRARCWAGVRSTVRRVVRGLRVLPMATGTVGAAATEGVTGEGSLTRSLGELIAVTSFATYISTSVRQIQYIRALRGPHDAAALRSGGLGDGAPMAPVGRALIAGWSLMSCCRRLSSRLPAMWAPTALVHSLASGHEESEPFCRWRLCRLLKCRDPERTDCEKFRSNVC